MTTFESYGATAVAACASLSFLSTLSLGLYIAYLVLQYRGIDTSCTPASTGIRFLRSQAGYLFVNLLAADFTQALGFGLSWVWAGEGQIDHSRHICTVQALAIEAGDVASAVFSLYIALHTAATLTLEKKANETFLRVACTCAWIFVAIVTAIGPLAIAVPQDGPFYASAGNWCWISDAYAAERLSLHYLFLYISAAGQLTSYLAIFIIIRFGITFRKQKLSDVENQEVKVDLPRPVLASPTKEVSNPKTQFYNRPLTSASVLRRKIDKTSLLMLLYPLVNLAVILPLSVFRLLGLAGQHGSPQALAVCGSIFALGGLANTILYSFSRRILSFQVRKCTVVVAATPTNDIDSNNGRTFASSPLGTPASDVTRVNSAPPTPFNYNSEAAKKLRELRLSPTSSRSSSPVKIIERPPSALLPAMKLERSNSALTRGSLSRPGSRHSAQPFADMTLVKVDQETMTWTEK